jgi:hypothetical protein
MNAPQKMPLDVKPVPAVKRHRAKTLLVALIALLLAGMTFGISPDDEAAIRSFQTAALRWQHDPEFRSLVVEYCILADSAMRTRPFLVPGPTIVMTARALPFAPHRYAVNPTSQKHYSKFSSGPLVAYLFLCGEQSVDQFVGILENVSRKPQPTQDDLVQFLQAFHMEYPVCQDAGARQSVATLIRDARSQQPFTVRKDVGTLLLPQVRALAAELEFPPEPEQMTPEQQITLLHRLDDYVKQHDYELWRTKQLNDFAGGVWAQVYAPHYHLIIGPALAVRQVGTWGLLFMLLWALLRRPRRIAVVEKLPESNP